MAKKAKKKATTKSLYSKRAGTVARKQVAKEYAPKYADYNSQKSNIGTQWDNDRIRNQADSQLALRDIESERTSGQGKLANLLASRGINVGEKSDMNVRNLNQGFDDRVQKSNKEFADSLYDITSKRNQDLWGINSQIQQAKAQQSEAIRRTAMELDSKWRNDKLTKAQTKLTKAQTKQLKKTTKKKTKKK